MSLIFYKLYNSKLFVVLTDKFYSSKYGLTILMFICILS